MELTEIFRIILLILLIVCAVCVNLTGNLLAAVIIFMSYSSIMCLVWLLMESPDLAITEAAVGAGISGVLFLLTLRRIRVIDASEDAAGYNVNSDENTKNNVSAGNGPAGNSSLMKEDPAGVPQAEKEGEVHE